MRGLSVVVSLLACWCAGCLSSDAPAAKAWTLDAAPSAPAAGVLEGAGKAAFTTTRVGAVSVDAPYDKTPFVVRRADGSVAFDHYNVFAASPAALLRAQGFRTAAMALRDDSLSIDDPRLLSEEKLAVVLGTEGDGLAAGTIANTMARTSSRLMNLPNVRFISAPLSFCSLLRPQNLM